MNAPPLPEDTLPLALERQVDAVCARFEADWKSAANAGLRPRIEEYLGDVPEPARAVLVRELGGLEVYYRRRAGEACSPAEYEARFPGLGLALLAGLSPPRPASFPWADPGLPPVTGAGGPAVVGYEILGELGRGGMGVVYKARQQSLDRLVALKVLRQECAQDPVWLGRFRREALTASALNHPHICTIHDTGEVAGRPFLSMELIEGQTLEKLLGQRLPIEEVARLLGQAARALAAAHAAGVVHRDIKPANLMVRDDGLVKVLDFGLARRLPSAGAPGSALSVQGTDPGTRVGTLLYMSPEQARARPVDTATDIFSLGLVLYELATGQHPFLADSEFGVLHALVTQEPVPPSRLNPEVSASLEALIQQMLAKDPPRRPTALEVNAALSGLLGPSTGRPAGPPPRPARRPTVGREQEGAALRAGFAAAAAGSGQVLCVTGEPGIGKTTLVEDFLAELAAGGQACRVARGRCSERLAGAEAYLPVLEALDSLARGEAGDSAARALRLLAPAWYAQVAPLAAGGPADPAAAPASSQERLKRELLALVEEASRSRPLVLFLDDVHWADASTVDLLAYLGSRCAGLRLLLVLTYRPTEMLLGPHPFRAVQLELQRHGVCREVALSFLSRAEVDGYLGLAFPGHRFPPEFAAVLHAQTEGNPLFLVDLLRYLQDRGVVAPQPDGWALVQAVPDFQRELPASVRSLIETKIAQLDEADRWLLSAASVQGHEFDAAVAARVLGREAAEVEERLEALDRVHGLVRRRREQPFPDGTLTLRYQFVHVLYQNTLYAALQPTRRAAWSAAAAQALLGHYGEQSAAAAAELALLFEAARDYAQAADYFLLASQNAARISANQEAVALARRAIGNADKLPGPARTSRTLAVALHRANLHQTLSQLQEALADFGLAEQAACEVGDTEARVNAICGAAMSLFLLKRLPESRQQGQRALDIARAAGSSVGVASAQQVLASERMCTGDLAAAEQYFDQALPVLREKGPPIQVLDAIGYQVLLHAWRLEFAEAERTSGWALAKARELGASSHIIHSLFQRSMALGNQGLLSEALTSANEARHLAELNGERYWLPRLPNTMGWLHRELQDLDAALRLDHEGVQMGRQLASSDAEANSHINLGHDYLMLGEPARAYAHLQEAERLYNQHVWFRWRFNLRLQAEMATYWIVRGDLEAAAGHAAASLRLAEETLSRKHMAWARKLLGDIAVLEERVEDGRRHLESALALLGGHPCPILEWRVLKAAAELARRLKNPSGSEELRGRSRAVVQSLANSIWDDRLRQSFLASKAVRDL
jgi:hypothetical protein